MNKQGNNCGDCHCKKVGKYQNNQNMAWCWYFSDLRNDIITMIFVARVCHFGSVAGFSLGVPRTDEDIENMGVGLGVIKVFKVEIYTLVSITIPTQHFLLTNAC